MSWRLNWQAKLEGLSDGELYSATRACIVAYRREPQGRAKDDARDQADLCGKECKRRGRADIWLKAIQSIKEAGGRL